MTARLAPFTVRVADLVDEMGRVQTGNLDLPDRPGVGFGIGFSVLRDPHAVASPESPGTWRWGGVYGHSWFVDRARGLTVVSLSNTLHEGMNGQYTIDLRDAVYGAGEVQAGDCARSSDLFSCAFV